MRTAYAIVEAVLAKELFHRGGVDDFGHLRRHAEHLHETHLVRLGQGVVHLVNKIYFGHKTSFYNGNIAKQECHFMSITTTM